MLKKIIFSTLLFLLVFSIALYAPQPERGSAGVEITEASDTFRMVILPDTQIYVYEEKYPEIFTSQTEWIAQNKDKLNIAFVLHEGDIVHTNSQNEWELASQSMQVLDTASVPYALAIGNHDMSMRDRTRETARFNEFFPVSEAEKSPAFGGVFEEDKLDNSYHLFSAEGTDWLVLALEFGPRDEVLAWADEVIGRHPERNVTVLTHTYLYSDNRLHGADENHPYNPNEYLDNANDGTQMWEKLISRHPNILFVFSGHILGSGTGKLITEGEQGNPVYQILANYQMLEEGGQGFLRILEVTPSANLVSVKTYSPHLDEYKTDSENQFILKGVPLR